MSALWHRVLGNLVLQMIVFGGIGIWLIVNRVPPSGVLEYAAIVVAVWLFLTAQDVYRFVRPMPRRRR